MNKIFDCHTHIDLKSQSKEKYQLIMDTMGIEKTIIMPDPFIKEIKCNNDLNHFVAFDDRDNQLIARCEQCKCIIYTGEDPYKNYNEQLIDLFNNTNYFPFLIIALAKSTINSSVQYFIESKKSMFYGFKIYTGLCYNDLNYIGSIDCDLPLLIHTGVKNNQNPMGMIKFLEKYKGKIVMSHFCRLHYEFLKIIKNLDNVFIDTSPAAYIFNRYIIEKREGGLFCKKDISDVKDLYYRLIECIGIDKIIFGTDYPYSNIETELSVINTLDITKDEYLKLTRKNFLKFLEK
jgi:hypothetical protein